MSLEQEFDLRIAEIHGLGTPIVGVTQQGDANAMDIRNAELHAMFDVFLGKDYDVAKKVAVEAAQLALHDEQAALYRRLEEGSLDAEQYLATCNALIEGTFRKCEEVLGPNDFRTLFGAGPDEVAGIVDRSTFFNTNEHLLPVVGGTK